MPIQTKPLARKWRDILPTHPAADLFPLMSSDELQALGEDIRKHGLHEPITVVRQYRRHADGTLHVGEYDLVLLDGRNRLEAMERAGFALIRDGKLDKTLGHRALGLEPLTGGGYAELDSDVDPYAFVISRNIHRRHLTTEQKREVIANLIKALPEKSDRQIAAMLGVSHHTVGTVRAEMERRGQIAHVETHTDSKGRKQPARKPWSKERYVRKRAEAVERNRKLAESVVAATQNIIAAARDDIGPTSGGELARKDAEIEQLRNDKRALEIKVDALERELAKAKAELDEIIAAQADDDVPPPAVDDGLDIPDYLDRTKRSTHSHT